MKEDEIAEVRRIRHEMSLQCDHDVDKYFARI